MANVNLGEISKKLYDLLAELEKEERHRVLSSVLALFGEVVEQAVGNLKSGPQRGKFLHGESNDFSGVEGSAKDFFAKKNPENRGEALAVAARYLELVFEKEVIGKNDFEKVFKDARRNFDSKNFARDIRNAVHNAKFFLSGEERETYKLSFYGQEYVDALPDREAAREIKRPGNAKKKAGKKTDESKE